MAKIMDLPVSFAIVDEVRSDDTRFLKIVIDVLHTGLNFNGSIFNEDVVNDAIPSIKNTPILGYILVDENGDTDDFTKHEYRLVKQSNGYKYLYDGSAYGVIPESCNPRWITKVCSDGQMRKFLQVDALLWTKFDRAVEIFERDVVKGQSMELADNYEGIENSDGTFTFTKFLFNGCCILSTTDPKIQPAMINSTAVLKDFSVDNIAAEIKEKYTEYCAVIDKLRKSDEKEKSEEGGQFNLNKEKMDILGKYSVDPESLDFSVDDDMSLEEFEAKVSEFAKNQTKNPDKSDFVLNGNMMDELIESLCSEKMEDDFWGVTSKYSFVDFDNEALEVYAYDKADWKLYGFKFEVSGDKITVLFNTKKRKKFVIVDFETEDKDNSIEPIFELIRDRAIENSETAFNEEKNQFNTKFDNLEANYNALKTDYDNLVEANEQREAAELKEAKESLFEKFEKELSADEAFSALKDNMDKYSVEDLEMQCFALIGKKKANFTMEHKKTPEKIRIPDSVPVIPNPYGNLFD